VDDAAEFEPQGDASAMEISDPFHAPAALRRTGPLDHAFDQAVQLAASLDHAVITTEHLLVALTQLPEAAAGFQPPAPTREALRHACMGRLALQPTAPDATERRLSAELTQILESAAAALSRHAEADLRILSVEQLFASLPPSALTAFLPRSPTTPQPALLDRTGDGLREAGNALAAGTRRIEDAAERLAALDDAQREELRSLLAATDRIRDDIAVLAARIPDAAPPEPPHRRRWWQLRQR
jgi:ATP-dependent Clp protease ATP-binding subunit ClpA